MHLFMKQGIFRPFIFSITVVFLLFLSSSAPIVVSLPKLADPHLNDNVTRSTSFQTWVDGEFSGVWKSSTTNQQGILTGSIYLGRSDHQGQLIGVLQTQDHEQVSALHGFYHGSILFGKLKQHTIHKSSLFVGTLTRTMDTFDFHFYSPSLGSVEAQATYTASFLPPLTGSYEVGVKSYHLMDDSRDEPFTESTDDHRELMMQIWYPSVNTTDATVYDYMDPTTFQWLKTQSPVPLFTIPSDAYRFVRPHAKQDVMLALSEKPYPVLIFSHGYDGVYQIYTSFIEDMVSHGYIVVSINHPHIAGITVFPDGKSIDIAPVPIKNREEHFYLSLRTVVEDAKFVLDQISQFNQTVGPWQGRFDLSRVGMYGHSFGGAATAVCCLEDDRFKAGLTLDGVFYENFLNGSIDEPFLMMFTQARYLDDEGADLMWDRLQNNSYRLGIEGSSHYSYTDVGILLSHLTPLLPAPLLGFGYIDPKRMVDITRSITLSFFNVALRYFPAESLETLTDDIPEVSMTKR